MYMYSYSSLSNFPSLRLQFPTLRIPSHYPLPIQLVKVAPPFIPCRLDHKGNVRVGDFGLAEDMYARGYVRESSKTVKVPYKWMPPESLEDGVFSELSDVV